jgi:hypothetical protein
LTGFTGWRRPNPVNQVYIGRGSAGVTLAKVVCPTDNGGTIDSSYVIGDIGTLPTCKLLELVWKLEVS